MHNELIELLESEYEYPVFRQGSLGDEESYPDHFFTFWNNDTEGSSYYDNSNHNTIWNFDLNFYSIDVEKVNTMLPEALKLLRKNGWIANGEGHDEPSHTGRGINIIKEV